MGLGTARSVSGSLVARGDAPPFVVTQSPPREALTHPWLLGSFDENALRRFAGPMGALKRSFDVLVALALLSLLSPLLLLVAVAVKLGDGGPVLYRQSRVGLHGKTFAVLKFRSMVDGAEHQVIDLTDHNITDGLLFKMNGDPRVTKVGQLIRRFSIDELPQLWNVVKGEMSLVGPRPLPVEPEDFDPRANLRHCVKPGLTGVWQVSGGNGLSYDEMIDLDLAYVRTHSMWQDVRLLARTAPALLDRTRPV